MKPTLNVGRWPALSYVWQLCACEACKVCRCARVNSLVLDWKGHVSYPGALFPGFRWGHCVWRTLRQLSCSQGRGRGSTGTLTYLPEITRESLGRNWLHISSISRPCSVHRITIRPSYVIILLKTQKVLLRCYRRCVSEYFQMFLSIVIVRIREEKPSAFFFLHWKKDSHPAAQSHPKANFTV